MPANHESLSWTFASFDSPIRRFVACLILLLFTNSISANDFLNAAMRRAKAFTQFEIRIETDEEHRPGSTQDFTRPGTKSNPNSQQPAKTTRFHSLIDVLIANDKIRFSEESRIWNTRALDFVPHYYRITNDGESLRSLSLNNPDDTKTGYGIIEYAHLASYRRQALQPILLAFRGGESRLSGIRAEQLKPTGRNQIWKDRSYPEWAWQDGPNTATALVAPLEDWNAKTLSFARDGRIHMTIDITNVRDEQSGLWYPKQWVVQNFRKSDGLILSTLKSEMTAVNFSVSSQPKDFVLQFPEGLYVSNNKTKSSFRADRNGKLIPTSPDGDERTTSGIWGTTWFVLVLIVLGILLAFFVIRHLSRARHSQEFVS